jgi:probable HAF family extracellular repeat protein
MGMNRRIRYFVALVVTVATSTLTFAQQYTITPLDHLGGHSESRAMGINNLGQIVGFTVDANGNSQAATWQSSGSGNHLSVLSQTNPISEAYRINNAGQIVGKARTDGNATHAAYWAGGGVTDIGVIGGVTSFANDINEAGVVAGSSDATRGSVAFTWTPGGGFVNYGNFNTTDAQQRAGFNGINDTGALVGTAYRLFSPFKAIKATAGVLSVTEISPPGQFSTGMALAVNDAGTIVGYQNPGSGGAHAAIFDGNGGFQDLGALGLTDSQANDINQAGVIVGDAFGDDGQGNFLAKSFVYQNNVMTDLLTLIAPGSGWTELFAASGVNDLGQIVGTGVLNGEIRGYVLTPIPEPASVSLISIGAITLIARRPRPA